MCNYIKSELYKIFTCFSTKSVLLESFIFASIASFIGLNYLEDIPSLFLLYKELVFYSFFFSLLIVEIVFRDEFRYTTLKNPISFGIKRSTLFIGKLLTSIIIESLFVIIFIGTLIISSILFFHSDKATVFIESKNLLIVLAHATPFLLAGIAIANSLEFIAKDKLDFLIAFLTVVFVPSIIAGIMELFKIESLTTFNKLLIIPTLKLITQQGEMNSLSYICVGMTYFIVFSALGLLYFKKSEIK